MTNETTASQPKSIGDDAQFRFFLDSDIVNCLRSLATDPMCGADVPVGKALLAETAKRLEIRAPVAQASAEVVRNNVPGSPHNVCRTTEHNLRKRIAELEAQASATIQAAPEVCAVCNGTRCVYGAAFDPPSECEACMDQSPPDATIQEPVMVVEPKPPTCHGIGFNSCCTNACAWKAEQSAAPMVADPAGVAMEQAAQICDKLFRERGGAAFLMAAQEIRTGAATVKAVPSEALDADPLDTKLPCDVVIGGMTIRKGVRLGTLVGKAQRDNARLMELLPKPTPEQIAAFNALLPDQDAIRALAAPLADKAGGGA